MRLNFFRAGRFLIVLLSPGLLVSQEVRSTIFGTVLDPQSSAVVGADVTVTNTNTGVSSRLKTNETGYYEAKFLLPGPYDVTAAAPGFKESIRRGLDLQLRTNLQIDIHLEVGAVNEQVTVVGEAPLVETSGVSAGRIVDRRTLSDLPIFYNNTIDLMRFAPGAFHSGIVASTNALHAGGGAVDVTMAGGVGSNAWSLDGAPNIGRSAATYPADTPAFDPHTDVIQEVKIETFNFDASVGFTAGVNVTMLSKTGSNQFHGVAADQYWNQRWNGSPFFLKQQYYRSIAQAEAAGNHTLVDSLRHQDKQAPGHDNNYIGTIGGPVILPKIYNGKDKLFFFLSYNGMIKRASGNANTYNRTVPTLAERTGDFSDLLPIGSQYQLYDPLSVKPDPARPGHFIRTPLSGNRVPLSRIINPVYQYYLKGYPVPNNNPTDPSKEPYNNYLSTAVKDLWDYRAITNRVDYQPSEKHHFFGRWNYWNIDSQSSDWTYETIPGLTESDGHQVNKIFALDWVYVVNAGTVLNVSTSYSGMVTGALPPAAQRVKPSAVGLPAYLDQHAGDKYNLPLMSINYYNSFGVTNYPAQTYFRLPGAKANLSHVRGAHSFVAGLEARRYMRTQTLTGGTGGGSFLGGNTSGNFSFNSAWLQKNDDNLTPPGTLGFGWAAFMMGLPSSITIAANDSYITQNPAYAWYGQDTYRASRKLTLTFGLRLEYERGPVERYNRWIGRFDPTLALSIANAAQAAYAATPIPELSASAFQVRGGSTYVGVNGVSRQAWGNQLMPEPRVAAAYQLNPKTVLRAGYGIFYDTLNCWSWTSAVNQLGYTRNTTTPITNDAGVTWLVGDPAAGISPLVDPFRIRSDGTRYDEPTGNKLGAMAVQGSGFSFTDPSGKHARQQRWRVGVQRQFGNNMVIDLAYAGSRSDHVSVGGGFNDPMSVSQNLNATPGQYWADGTVRNNEIPTNLGARVTNPFYIGNFADLKTSNPLVYQDLSSKSFFTSPTISKGQLIAPFPNMTGLTETLQTAGKVRTHELDVSFTRRFARGFNLNAGYTRLYNQTADYYYNPFDLDPSWREGRIGRPHRFWASSIVELPFGKGRPFLNQGVPSAIFGGFQVGVSYEFQPGPLIDWPNLFYYGTDLSQIKNGPHTLSQWFNTDNFERTPSLGPAAYNKRVFPTRINGVRADIANFWNGNIQREFSLTERARLQLRGEGINLLNRSQFNPPATTPSSTTFGQVTSTTAMYNRFIQVQARISF